ncbi:hypothetical protein [Prevotella sp.]|uniref:hypothetical protein n=1 Tax=Prevotella sp. TaxID=59823 RepID=UPI002F95DA13
MKKLFADYLRLYSEFPKGQYLTKLQKKQRKEALNMYGVHVYNEEIYIDDLVDFIIKYGDSVDMSLSFMRQIAPVLKHDIASGGTVALKYLLIASAPYKALYYNFTDFCWETFGDEHDLLELLIERESDYLPAFEVKFWHMEHAINFTLHELPYCVLLDKDAIPSALKRLDEFKEVSLKLGKDTDFLNTFVKEARHYYIMWQDFLENRHLYDTFSQYLSSHGEDFGLMIL